MVKQESLNSLLSLELVKDAHKQASTIARRLGGHGTSSC